MAELMVPDTTLLPVGASELRTAEWWRDRLLKQLLHRRIRVSQLERYYEGKHPLPSPPKRLQASVLAEARKAYSHLMELGITNWVKLVADAPSERLEVVGFRFGEPSATQKADQGAWRIWQANNLDADSALVHDNAFHTGNSAVLVDPFVTAGDVPRITCEHSSEMIVAYAAGSRRERAAALKVWDDDSGRRFVTLYLPDALWKWQTRSVRPNYGEAMGETTWEPRQPDGEPWPLPNPLHVVPVVEFRANPSLKPAPFGGGTAEYETVLPIQERINKTVFDRLVTAEFQAFRQRWVVGWTPDIDPKTGVPRADQTFKAAQAFIMAFGGNPDEIKVGEFPQADFTGFIKAVESDVNAMAAISKTPPHYLLGAMVNISGDALTAAESGLAAKTKKHARNFGESWEEVIRLALKAMGDPKADDQQSQILWGDIEHRSWSEQVDAVLKMQALGVPQEALWAMLPGVSQQDVARWKAMNEMAGLTAPNVIDATAEETPSPNGARPPELTGAGTDT